MVLSMGIMPFLWAYFTHLVRWLESHRIPIASDLLPVLRVPTWTQKWGTSQDVLSDVYMGMGQN